MGRNIRRFVETEANSEIKADSKPTSNEEIHIYQTDCFSFLYSKLNRICKCCFYCGKCKELQESNQSTLKQMELDYRKVYVHEDTKEKQSIDDLKNRTGLNKDFNPVYSDSAITILSLPMSLYMNNTSEVFDLLGIIGKNYLSNLHPLLRSDYGLVTIKKHLSMRKKEEESCIIKIIYKFDC